MTGGFRGALRTILHTGDTPHRTALAFGIGVFIAFSPFLGLHIWIALLISVLFRLNRVAILVGTYLNNPWTFAPIYLAATSLGCALLGVSTAGLSAINWNLHGRDFYRSVWRVLRHYLWPLTLGSMLLGLLCAALGYLLVRHVIERRRAREGPPAAAQLAD